MYVFTTKQNVKDIAELKDLKPRTDRAPFVLVSVEEAQLKDLKKLGLETFPADNTEYFHRVGVHVKEGIVKTIFEFPKAVGVKPNANQNEFIAKDVNMGAEIPAERPNKTARVS